mmetsp:Transcript_25974/g.56108  ORF Transcript_25974/g.56108 Transcript_25974/m.56108 type:complete len:335 (-) Transcript_25974:759-1763(-)
MLVTMLSLAFMPPPRMISAVIHHGHPAATWVVSRGTTSTMAAPEIAWQRGTVVANRPVARGTHLLSIRSGTPLSYQPGHILGLELQHPETGDALKGPYTVTRQTGSDTIDVIYRVVRDGRKTPFMERLVEGDELDFGGKFGTPIAEGVAPGAVRVVGIATGAGIGPLLGYAECALQSSSTAVELYCGFRELADVCCAPELDALAEAHPDRFAWTACISRPMACTAVTLSAFKGARAAGRVTHAVPSLLRTTRETHFHLVGNGAFVKEFKEGCLAAGVEEGRVTTEIYFNGKAEPDQDVVALVSSSLRKLDEADEAHASSSSDAEDNEVAVVSLG